MNRPVLWAALAFAGGIGAMDVAPWPLAFVIGGALFLLGLYVVPHTLPYRDGFLVALVFFLAGSVWTLYRAPEWRSDALADHNRRNPTARYTLEGTVVEAPIRTAETDYMAVRLRVDSGFVGNDPIPVPGGVLLRWSRPNRALHAGERVRVHGRLYPVLGDVNLDIQGVEDYYRRHGYHSTLRIRGDALKHLSSPTFHIRYWASRLRQWEADLFGQTVPESAQPLVRAVWLGDRSALSPDAYAPYLKTGTAHILAVSGVHIGILYLTLQLILRGVFRNRKGRAAVILACIMVFALVTGGRTPILRATIMLSLYLWAEFLDREPDAPTALSLAALLFLGYNPGLLRDTGFALSFTSLGSLLLYSQLLAERFTALPLSLRQNIGATLGVSILPLPLTAHVFHVLGVIGPLCNLLVIPLLTALLWLCLLIVVIAPLSITVASLFGHAAEPVVWAIQTVAQVGAAIPGGHRIVTSPTWLACFVFGLFAFAVYRWAAGHESPKRWLGLTCFAALATWLLWQPLYRPATVDFLDVGHGDATFVRTPGGTTLLIDAGNESEYVDLGARTVAPWLLAQGVDYLDYVLVTHPDQDHIGGVISVLDRVTVGEVVLWPWHSEDAGAKKLVAYCAASEIPIRRVGAGDTLVAAGATLSVLHPDREQPLRGINNQSIVLHVQWPGMNALLTGDIEALAERALLPHLSPVDVLKVPHHGSFTSSTEAFLDATDAQLAIASTRDQPPRVPMTPGVNARYEARKIPVYRTDHHGGIRVRQRHGLLYVETARGQRGYSLAPNDN